MKQKDVLFLCQFFYPEHVSSATLPFDTACSLAKSGWTVDALVGEPREYADGKRIPSKQRAEDVGIRRIKYLQLNRSKKLGRLINYFSFTCSVLFHIRTLKHHRCVIVYSNPPVLPIVPILANRLWKTKFVFVAYDVYPEIAYASNSVRPGSLIDRVMQSINRKLYRRASAVVALSDEMQKYLLAHRPELTADRVCTIPNWAHETYQPGAHDGKSAFGFAPGTFVVSYFGNMGVCQDMQTLMDAASALRDDPRIRFLLVGHGNKLPSIRQRIEAERMDNVKVYDFLTGEMFQKALAASDCSVVSLERGLMGTCAPSKYYSCLQCGIPVLAVVEPESYLAGEVETEHLGAAVPVGNARQLADAICRLSSSATECRQMGERARSLYLSRYAVEHGTAAYCHLIKEILKA